MRTKLILCRPAFAMSYEPTKIVRHSDNGKMHVRFDDLDRGCSSANCPTGRSSCIECIAERMRSEYLTEVLGWPIPCVWWSLH